MTYRYKRFPADIEAFIRAEYRKGRSDSVIAARIGCRPGMVEYFRRQNGLIKKAKPEPIAEVRALAADNLTAAEIAAKLGIQKRAVVRIAHRNKIAIRPPDYRQHAHQPWRDEPPVAPPVASFAELIGTRRYDDDPRSVKPQPVMVIHRPATYVAQRGYLG